MHNDHLLAPDKIETKREMLYEYKWKIADLYNISIGNVKKLVANLFDKKVRASLRQLTTFLEARIKSKKVHCILEFNQSQCLNPYTEFNTKKRIKAEINGAKDGKVFYKSKKNAVYGKTMEKVRNRINVQLVNKACTWKPSYMSHKIFDNNLLLHGKAKVH